MSVFFKTNREQKEYVKEKTKKYYPNFKTGGELFYQYLSQYLTSESSVVDVGCGQGGLIAQFQSVPKTIIGIDADKQSLEANAIVKEKIIANLEQIPLEPNSIDLAVSEFVLEHLEAPERVFPEIARILKPDGVFIFITPNIFNPIMFLSKILPCSTHEFLKRRLLKTETPAQSTYYRANSCGRLRELGRRAGFKKIEISHAGNPEYLSFCKPLTLPAVILEKMIDNKFLAVFKMYLIGCFVK